MYVWNDCDSPITGCNGNRFRTKDQEIVILGTADRPLNLGPISQCKVETGTPAEMHDHMNTGS